MKILKCLLLSLALAPIFAYAQFTVFQGGTGKTTYPLGSMIYYDGFRLSATSSQPLYVGSIFATSTGNNTINGGLLLPNLSQGFAGIGSSGRVYSFASSSISISQLTNDLANLTAGNTSLTFSGNYNGSAARTIILNVGNANSWTALQNFLNASSSLLSAGYAKIGSTASTTIDTAGNVSLPAAGTLTVPALTSALILTDGNGLFAEYGGAAACTNQFVTALSVVGATTCASINNAQWSGTQLAIGNGGTGSTSFAPNSFITSNSAGTALIATTSHITISSLLATSTTAWSVFLNDGVMFGTSTPVISPFLAVFASSTVPQISLSAGAGFGQVTFRNDGTNFYISTSTVQGLATTSISALEIALGGFGTTTLRGLNISGQATSTSNVGYNITTGCYAIANTCLSTSAGSGIGDPFTHSTIFPQNSATTSKIGIGTTTPYYSLTIASTTGSQLALSDGTAGIASWVLRNAGGNLYLSTTTTAGTATTSTAALELNGSGKPAVSVSSSTPNATLTIETRAGDYSNSMFIGSSTELFRMDSGGKMFANQTLSSGASQTGYWCYDANGQFIRDTAVCLVSARKFKTDIKDLNVGLKELLQMKPVSYHKKDPLDFSDSHLQMGFVADDVPESLKEMLVTYDSNGDVHGFRYEQFTALVTKSIQELTEKVTNNVQIHLLWWAFGILALWNILITGYLIKRK